MTIEEVEEKLKQLRKEWKQSPDMRGVIEKRAKLLQFILDRRAKFKEEVQESFSSIK